jgi:hypothetical protein
LIFEVVILALASAPRPAGLAALYALLSARHPRRVLAAYLVAGFVFSVAIGLMIVSFFHGVDVRREGTTLNALVEMLAGAVALGYAAGVGTGRAELPSRGNSAGGRQARMIERLQQPSVGTAAVAGVATHLPGLFYLVALNAIVADGGSVAAGIAAVLLFNAIWFVSAFAAVVYFLIRPGAARRAFGRASAWARKHARGTTVLVFAVVGAYLFVKGTYNLVE